LLWLFLFALLVVVTGCVVVVVVVTVVVVCLLFVVCSSETFDDCCSGLVGLSSSEMYTSLNAGFSETVPETDSVLTAIFQVSQFNSISAFIMHTVSLCEPVPRIFFCTSDSVTKPLQTSWKGDQNLNWME